MRHNPQVEESPIKAWICKAIYGKIQNVRDARNPLRVAQAEWCSGYQIGESSNCFDLIEFFVSLQVERVIGDANIYPTIDFQVWLIEPDDYFTYTLNQRHDLK